MLAWDLFKKSVLLIADNLGPALRVSLVPYVILVCVTFYYADASNMGWLIEAQAEMQTLAPDDPAMLEVLTPPAGFAQAILFTSLAQFLTYVWIAVGWHRYVLIGDGGHGWLPALRGPELLGYIGRTLLLGLIYFGAAFVLYIVVGLIMPVLMVPAATILWFLIFYRAGVILPAGAIEKPIQLGEAWSATKGQTGTIILLALMTFALALVLQIPGGLTSGDGLNVVSMLYGLVTGWIILMVGVGVLSTLYGHFVEGRSLD
jgi:hypothetical protein